MAFRCDQRVRKIRGPPGASSRFPGVGALFDTSRTAWGSSPEAHPLFGAGGGHTLRVGPRGNTPGFGEDGTEGRATHYLINHTHKRLYYWRDILERSKAHVRLEGLIFGLLGLQ